MLYSLPFKILVWSIAFLCLFYVVTYVSPLPTIISSAGTQRMIYDAVTSVTFLPATSLMLAILRRDTKHRQGVIWLSSLWVTFWLLVIFLYSLTKGR